MESTCSSNCDETKPNPCFLYYFCIIIPGEGRVEAGVPLSPEPVDLFGHPLESFDDDSNSRPGKLKEVKHKYDLFIIQIEECHFVLHVLLTASVPVG